MTLAKIGKVCDYTISFFGLLAGIQLVGIMVVIVYAVVARYFFHVGLGWPVEICEYMLFLLCFLGAAWTLREERHVRVDIVANMLNPEAKTLLRIATSATGVVVCLIIAGSALGAAISHFERGVFIFKSLMVPKAPFLGMMSLCFLLLSVQFLRHTCDSVKGWRAMRKGR